jgi:hypothetical protein
MVLGYGGIVYGGASQAFLVLSENRGYDAGFVFAITAWSGVAATAVYLLNAFFGERFERKYTQLFGAILFAGAWWGVYAVHNTAALTVFYIIVHIGTVLWLWNMYVYIPINYPTRMRSLGTGWTDGVGHLGAWGGVLIAGAIFSATAPLGWIVFITIPCALVPALLIAAFGQRQRSRSLEELPDKRWVAGCYRRPFPRCLRRPRSGVTGDPVRKIGLPPGNPGGRPTAHSAGSARVVMLPCDGRRRGRPGPGCSHGGRGSGRPSRPAPR